LFHHSRYDEIRNIIKEQEKFLNNPPVIEDGVIECYKCHSKKTYSYAKQTRASDEGTSVFVKCAECNHQFRL
jgi:DNA-directed RNA polymerase subunit M/transcription elongation factor TFIIS